MADWTLELAQKFEHLLMEYHDIFSLDKNEIGCTDATEHVIKLLDEEPFKEKFQQIAPPLLDEVREHLQEMLDGGAIQPSQSARTKKDSYPLPQMQEMMESMVGAQFFSTMDLKSRFWQVKMSEKSQ